MLKPYHIPQNIGLDQKVPKLDRPVYQFIQTLPKDSLIAGWPSAKGSFIDHVPYLSKRPAFFTGITHKEDYTYQQQVLQDRFYALVDAYFATNMRSINALKEGWSVTHMVVDLRDFSDHPPGYKQPYQTYVSSLWKKRVSSGKPFILETLARHHAIFSSGHLRVIDLSHIASE